MQHDAYDEEEFWSRDQIEATQLARLKNVVARVYKGCEFYRKRLDEAGVTPDSIKTLDDIEKIPMTSKDDLRSQYPLGLVIVPRNPAGAPALLERHHGHARGYRPYPE